MCNEERNGCTYYFCSAAKQRNPILDGGTKCDLAWLSCSAAPRLIQIRSLPNYVVVVVEVRPIFASALKHRAGGGFFYSIFRDLTKDVSEFNYLTT